jgi:hypothetical protein
VHVGLIPTWQWYGPIALCSNAEEPLQVAYIELKIKGCYRGGTIFLTERANA